MIEAKTLWLVANAASGSNSDTALDTLYEGFAGSGCEIVRQIAFPDEGVPSVETLRAAGVDLLVIFTGDGSINAIVNGVAGWDGQVLVLPGGTMNMLARRLHGDADVAEIIERVAAGRSRAVRPTVVRTRYGDGLSGVLAGPGAAWGEVREALREIDVIGAISSAAEAIGESTGGPKVHCRNPDCGRPEGYSAIQVIPTPHGLAVHGYYAETFADYAKQGLALLRRNFREGPHDSLGPFAAVHLACPEGEEMGLLIDGEACEGTAREEAFTLAFCEVDLLATADEA